VDATVLAGLGAFLSGAGSVLGAWVAIRAMRRRMTRECEERFALFKEGIEIGEQHDRLDP
jgi:hypothetical protein